MDAIPEEINERIEDGNDNCSEQLGNDNEGYCIDPVVIVKPNVSRVQSTSNRHPSITWDKRTETSTNTQDEKQSELADHSDKDECVLHADRGESNKIGVARCFLSKVVIIDFGGNELGPRWVECKQMAKINWAQTSRDDLFCIEPHASHWIRDSQGRARMALNKASFYYSNPAQAAT